MNRLSPEVHFDFAGTKELIFIYFFKTFEGQKPFITQPTMRKRENPMLEKEGEGGEVVVQKLLNLLVMWADLT